MHLNEHATHKVFYSFLVFGILNNVLYVVILSAAVDIVGLHVPKAVVLLADIVPSLTMKMAAPLFIHKLSYKVRVWLLSFLSASGMILISLPPEGHLTTKALGISIASASSGLGEISFLQLTHFFDEKESLGGFSMGTGGAGILGSFSFMLMTNILRMTSRVALASFSILPLGFPIIFNFVLPDPITGLGLDSTSRQSHPITELNPGLSINGLSALPGLMLARLHSQVCKTIGIARHLFIPFMIPLCTVYIAEYTINQGIAPTMLFPLSTLPGWLFESYRDIYVVYGFVYQLGVFISRSSLTFGFRFNDLYVLSLLQFLNVIITLCQSMYDLPFTSIYPLIILVFYEGLLGGLLYVNTFLNVSQSVDPERRELAMACVGVSDSLGIMIAGIINIWLETFLCGRQTSRGKDWCKVG